MELKCSMKSESTKLLDLHTFLPGIVVLRYHFAVKQWQPSVTSPDDHCVCTVMTSENKLLNNDFMIENT